MIRPTLISLTAIVCCLTVLGGCDDSFSPFVSGPTDPVYVLSGILSAEADTQFVRVQVVRRVAELGDAVAGEVEVESFYVGSDTVITWSDSLATMNDGSIGHLFYAVFNPIPGETITVRAFGADGQTDETVRIPIKPDLLRSTPSVGDVVITENVTLTGISSRPDDLFIRYIVFDSSIGRDRVVDLSYANAPGLLRVGGWQFPVVYTGDRLGVASALGTLSYSPVVLRSISIHVTEYGPEWDTRRPSEVGFIGSIGRYTIPFELDPAIADSLNYIY